MQLLQSAAAVLASALLCVACDRSNPVGPDALSSVDALIAALEGQGATVVRVEVMPRTSHPYFSVNGERLLVNSGSVTVFEYATADAADRDAARVSADGYAIGTTQIFWIDVPRFYKSGQLIVLYVGRESAVVRPLESVLGSPFAGAVR